jgi:two-component system sensor histidine kinase PilS (NtrC family)
MKSIFKSQPLPRLYSFFSLGVALLFLGFYLFEDQLHWWQPVSPKLLPLVLSGYLTLAISAVITTRKNNKIHTDQMLPYFMTDILIFGFLLLYLTPSQTDIPAIMFITVGLGNFLVSKQYGFLLAALATLMVLSHSFVYPQNEMTDRFLSGSFISMGFFLEAALIQSLKTGLSEARTSAKESKNKLLTASKVNSIIIDRMQTGVCVVNNSGKILSLNRSVKERISPNEIGSNVSANIFERMKVWQEHELQNDDALNIKLKNGTLFTVMISFAEISDTTTLIFIEDKDTVTRRANQFKLESLARMAASIAHEIRNPLNAVSHAAQLIQDNPKLDEDDARLCDIIVNQSTRMDGIIQNVLQISKRRTTEPKWLQLDQWISKFTNDFLEQNKVAFSIKSIPMKIRFDPSQLHQVLWNIASNSVRYGQSSETSPIIIEFKQLPKRASILIMDNGPGITAHELKYLFEPFHTTSAKGTGLGLYLVKELCEANHAEIKYHNRLNGGACFEILFAPDFSHHAEAL